MPASRRLVALAAEAFPAFLLVALTALLYGTATRLWWLDDDFFNLRFVRAWSPGDYCLDPSVWQSLPFRMLTPLLFVSLDTDLAAFGAQPRAFYLHQLAALALAAAALYALLRAWLRRRWALLGAVMFLAGAPLAALATSLMARHYVECLALTFLAGAAWMRARRSLRDSAAWWWSAVSALLWLAAALAKEIAVPLVLLLPLVADGTRARRLRLLVPPCLALVGYVVYRRYLMGAWVGGYGWVLERDEWLRLAATLPWRLGREIVGDPSVAACLGLVALLAGIALALRGRRALLVCGFAVLLALLPLLAVLAEVEPRYAALPWAVVVVAFVSAVSRVRGGGWIAAVAAVALLVANRDTWDREMDRVSRASTENQALLRLGRGELLRQPLTLPASLAELQRYGKETLGSRGEGGWFLDDLYLCLHGAAVRRLWEYDDQRRRVVDHSDRLPLLRHAHCDGLRPAAPLDARFRAKDGVLRWRLGPYADGRWTFVFADGGSAFPVPQRGGYHLRRADELPLYVRYDAPAGWTTYSGLLGVDLAGTQSQRWTRPGR